MSSFMRHIQVHGGPTLLGPYFQKWGTCVRWPHERYGLYFFEHNPIFFKNGLNHDMLVMHVILWFNTKNENINV
jgi:hypothetical protein